VVCRPSSDCKIFNFMYIQVNDTDDDIIYSDKARALTPQRLKSITCWPRECALVARAGRVVFMAPALAELEDSSGGDSARRGLTSEASIAPPEWVSRKVIEQHRPSNVNRKYSAREVTYGRGAVISPFTKELAALPAFIEQNTPPQSSFAAPFLSARTSAHTYKRGLRRNATDINDDRVYAN